MMKKIISLIILLTFLIGFASAIPEIPHQFYGVVKVDGEPADNNIIVATIGGKNYSAITKSGFYGIAPDVFFVEDPDGENAGKEIIFYVGGKKANTYIFKNNELTRLDFSSLSTTCGDSYCLGKESCSFCSSDCGICKTPPEIFIDSPINKAYNTTKVGVNFYSDQNILIWMYSLNSGESQKFSPNVTMTLNEGNYELRIIAINEAYQINSKTVSFSIDIPSNYCGDGTCSNGESCSTCAGDCGGCSSGEGGGSSGGGGGSGGSSGGSSPKTTANSSSTSGKNSTSSFSSELGNINEEGENFNQENNTNKKFFPSITGAVISFGENLGAFKSILIVLAIVGIPILIFVVVKSKRKKISDYL